MLSHAETIMRWEEDTREHPALKGKKRSRMTASQK
jgi:hypothetical protein